MPVLAVDIAAVPATIEAQAQAWLTTKAKWQEIDAENESLANASSNASFDTRQLDRDLDPCRRNLQCLDRLRARATQALAGGGSHPADRCARKYSIAHHHRTNARRHDAVHPLRRERVVHLISPSGGHGAYAYNAGERGRFERPPSWIPYLQSRSLAVPLTSPHGEHSSMGSRCLCRRHPSSRAL